MEIQPSAHSCLPEIKIGNSTQNTRTSRFKLFLSYPVLLNFSILFCPRLSEQTDFWS